MPIPRFEPEALRSQRYRNFWIPASYKEVTTSNARLHQAKIITPKILQTGRGYTASTVEGGNFLMGTNLHFLVTLWFWTICNAFRKTSRPQCISIYTASTVEGGNFLMGTNLHFLVTLWFWTICNAFRKTSRPQCISI